MDAPQVSPNIEQSSAPRLRIEYLDSLRGLAALTVVVLHCFEIFGLNVIAGSNGLLTNTGFDRAIPFLYKNFIHRGVYAVQLFIVLSGYSLMLAVARSRDGKPSGGTVAYFKRRIRRIWPPYYGALALSLLIIILVPGMSTPSGGWWDLALPALKPDAILGHVLFLQHLNPDWFFKINPPMWTVAIEEHIYVMFPFLLLPFWRRFGSLSMVGVAIVASLGAWIAFHPLLDGARPWFLALFAMGALAASVGFSRRDNEQQWRQRVPWFKLAAAILAAFIVLTLVTDHVDLRLGDPGWLLDLLFGAAVACFLVHYTEQWKRGAHLARYSVLRLLHTRPLIGLGRYTYSLYLMHGPIVAIVGLLIRNAGITSAPAYALELAAGIPAALVGTYLFHLVFERPFMPASARLPIARSDEIPVVAAQTQTIDAGSNSLPLWVSDGN